MIELKNKGLILASKSPRRKQIMQAMGYDFRVVTASVEEIYPAETPAREVAEYLANLKTEPLINSFSDDIIIGADTIVLHNGEILGKPKDRNHAIATLQKLSGSDHEVITGVSIRYQERISSFSDSTTVVFRNLSDGTITHYVEHYEPYDKAGAYAIQEWIGMIGIKEIRGDYYNVMGLPIGRVHLALRDFLDSI